MVGKVVHTKQCFFFSFSISVDKIDGNWHSRSVRQPACQSVSHSLTQWGPVSQSVTHSLSEACQSVSHSLTQWVKQSVCHSQSVRQPVNRSVNQSVSHLDGLLVSGSVAKSWSVHESVSQPNSKQTTWLKTKLTKQKEIKDKPDITHTWSGTWRCCAHILRAAKPPMLDNLKRPGNRPTKTQILNEILCLQIIRRKWHEFFETI